jgi:hypothetical protein
MDRSLHPSRDREHVRSTEVLGSVEILQRLQLLPLLAPGRHTARDSSRTAVRPHDAWHSWHRIIVSRDSWKTLMFRHSMMQLVLRCFVWFDYGRSPRNDQRSCCAMFDGTIGCTERSDHLCHLETTMLQSPDLCDDGRSSQSLSSIDHKAVPLGLTISVSGK